MKPNGKSEQPIYQNSEFKSQIHQETNNFGIRSAKVFRVEARKSGERDYREKIMGGTLVA